ncbi:hypothetical protein E2C01_000272 [Portunus trituberculatus]|uniref:Uncharacterized protein n=1 Tax=Portunus trituberculatus TaxID=210409 RepID=A0A5B7CE84_PORTR|nr:hypothetical protein [Portunus trituberculatus]
MFLFPPSSPLARVLRYTSRISLIPPLSFSPITHHHHSHHPYHHHPFHPPSPAIITTTLTTATPHLGPVMALLITQGERMRSAPVC